MTRLIRSVLLCFALLLLPHAAKADVFISARIGPPPLPVYEQPWAPGPGYYWIPGYWAWDSWYEDYYWVPGTWVRPPRVGFYWTPGYWAWSAGYYSWYPGYWGPRVGYYGGINYGFGYTGHGYHGGHWRNNHFWYNSYVNRVRGDSARYVYRETVVNKITVNRVSYNGGDGGTRARPSRDDENYRRDRSRFIDSTDDQRRHERAAREDRGLRLSENRGRPATLALPQPARPRGGDARSDREPRNDRNGRDERFERDPRNGRDDGDRQRIDPRDPQQRDLRREQERLERDRFEQDRGNPRRNNEREESPTVIRGSQVERNRFEDRDERGVGRRDLQDETPRMREPQRELPRPERNDMRPSRDEWREPQAERIEPSRGTRELRGDPDVERHAPPREPRIERERPERAMPSPQRIERMERPERIERAPRAEAPRMDAPRPPPPPQRNDSRGSNGGDGGGRNDRPQRGGEEPRGMRPDGRY